MQPITRFCSIPYWRQSKWNAAKCIPILMALENGQLRAWDSSGALIFDVPIGAVRASMSRLGTMTLDAGGARYELVGRGNYITSPYSGYSQMAAMREFWAQGPPDPNGITADTITSAMPQQLKFWKQAFVDAGVLT